MSSHAAYSEFVTKTRLPSRLISTICGAPERRSSGAAGFRRNRDDLLDRPPIAVLVPQPHRRREVFDADDDADEAVRLRRIVCRSQLEHHLMRVPEIDALYESAFGHAPEVEMMAELAAEQVFGAEAVLDHRRCPPLRGDDRVVIEVPPDVVGEELVAAIELPRADDVEGVVVE